MATWTRTYLPIKVVLTMGGELNFKNLAEIVMQEEPMRFRDMSVLEDALDYYIDCLIYEDGKVRYNKDAIKYTKKGLFERSIQFVLHGSVRDMEKWQLYPLKTRKNSKTCYIGVPWEEIPPETQIEGEEVKPYIESCDFRTEDFRGSVG